ncbi:MAG TPA: nitroreductase family protein [Rectinemataceae bacterium]|nr:nitroreductase family protein [Rectinemataceae bacterium]
MDFDTVFLRRRSIRAFEDIPVPRETKARILEATLRAPTAGALMLYTVLEIEDPALKVRLAETCDHQGFIAKAPWVLVFLADYARLYGYFGHQGLGELCERTGTPALAPREADLLLACCDAFAAAQTLVCAAEALGLGSCYIGDVMENWEIHRELLNLPRYTFPITMLVLGHPTEQQRKRQQVPRLDADLVVHRDRYRPASPADYDRMYQGEGYGKSVPGGEARTPGQALYLRKFAAPYSEEMRRSVATMLEDWR